MTKDNSIAIASMKKDIEYIKKGMEDNTEDHKKIFTKIDKFIESAERRYASKWVESLLVWGGGVMGGAILLSLIGLILK